MTPLGLPSGVTLILSRVSYTTPPFPCLKTKSPFSQKTAKPGSFSLIRDSRWWNSLWSELITCRSTRKAWNNYCVKEKCALSSWLIFSLTKEDTEPECRLLLFHKNLPFCTQMRRWIWFETLETLRMNYIFLNRNETQ